MPIENSVGYGKQTTEKQEHFRKIIGLHLDIVKRITSKSNSLWPKTYTYIDMNAGPGIYNNDHGESIKGSPVIFLEECHRSGLTNKATFIDSCLCSCSSLVTNTNTEKALVEVFNADHAEIIRKYNEKPNQGLGIVYHDPNGNIPSFDLFSEMSNYRAFENIDFMIYVSTTNIKRARSANPGKPTLEEYKSKIRKKKWIVRDDSGRHGWSFVIGSNWIKFPDWQRLGFYDSDSPMGKVVMRKLNYTSKEIFNMSGQLCLF